jgi:hypothetical protein
MKLRRPEDRLAGCMWLPRFIDKARHHVAGTLAQDYQRAFCSPLGIDGVFFAHFALSKDEVIEVVRREKSDEAIAAWFVARAESSEEKIRAWNELAPNIGRPGFPGQRTFQWGMKHIYVGCSDPRVISGFTAIAWDEGFLDSVSPNRPNKAPEPTTMAVTSRAPSSTSRASHGRGSS